MSGKDTAGEQIHRIGIPHFLVIGGHIFIVDILPERRRIDASVLSKTQGRFHGMHIVDRK